MKVLNIQKIIYKAEHPSYSKSGWITNCSRRAINILKILTRDEFKCVRCGNTNNLTIDHINDRKFAKFDNAQKYKLEKCQTLCEKCHIQKNENKTK